MDFSYALVLLKKGCSVARDGWNGKGMWIRARTKPCAVNDGGMNLPFIYLCPEEGAFVPWAPSQSDLFATDWKLVDGVI